VFLYHCVGGYVLLLCDPEMPDEFLCECAQTSPGLCGGILRPA